jgi:serine/threonine protein kinase
MVIKAIHKKTGDHVALKQIRMDDMEKNGFPITALREVQILKMLNHKNILGLREMVVKKGWFLRSDCINISSLT